MSFQESLDYPGFAPVRVLSTRKMIKTLKLCCSQANVQKIYACWGLAGIKQAVLVRGVVSEPLPDKLPANEFAKRLSARARLTRCSGSTHTELSATKILDRYHIRWPVETGIKDLAGNYFLNKPTGDSSEKVEADYYCVMIARLLIDYFRGVLKEPRWRMPEGWESMLSTIRTSVFSNQNCELTLDDMGDLLLTYLDGEPTGVKANIRDMLERRRQAGLNRVSWWGGRGVRIHIEDRYGFVSGPENA